MACTAQRPQERPFGQRGGAAGRVVQWGDQCLVAASSARHSITSALDWARATRRRRPAARPPRFAPAG
jgi:hypothetical protein